MEVFYRDVFFAKAITELMSRVMLKQAKMFVAAILKEGFVGTNLAMPLV